MILDPTVKTSKAKFKGPYRGPYKVMSKLSPVIYQVLNLKGKYMTNIVNVKRLKPYNRRMALEIDEKSMPRLSPQAIHNLEGNTSDTEILSEYNVEQQESEGFIPFEMKKGMKVMIVKKIGDKIEKVGPYVCILDETF